MLSLKLVQIISVVIILLSLSGCMEKTDENLPSATPPANVKATADVTASPTSVIPATTDTSVKYLVLFDEYGFNQVLETTYKKKAAYENHTLTIKVGDIVEWRNEYDYKLTLVSDQGLWAPGETGAILTSRVFNYTFNKPGTFSFSIEKERVTPLTVIVNP